MDKWNDEVNPLFAQYRESVPDPEPSASFMPSLWRAIDARRSFTSRIQRVTRLILAGAAVACVAMIAAVSVPRPGIHESHATYTDVLAASHPAESLAALGIVRDPAELGK
ncbi:MAG TPA: hypothetical protein VKG25_16195 [Bryobacteraceae bacterium]|nr:hypothetical protein [Bryobacteraceae bacterium]